MLTCVCSFVSECEVRAVIRRGAHSAEAVGEACGAGTGCGTCLDRIGELLDEQRDQRPGGTGDRVHGRELHDTLAGPHANPIVLDISV